MTNTPERLADLRDMLTGLVGDGNALIRSAVRLALNELDLADIADDPNEHLRQAARILDAVLNPDPMVTQTPKVAQRGSQGLWRTSQDERRNA